MAYCITFTKTTYIFLVYYTFFLYIYDLHFIVFGLILGKSMESEWNQREKVEWGSERRIKQCIE